MKTKTLHTETGLDPRQAPHDDLQISVPMAVAVIDVGTTSLRMQISEVHPGGTIRKLESFSQAVSLGKDSFLKGTISRSTIEDCVHVLRIYRKKLDEYGIINHRQLRVIATSAVKEARNRLAFLDRIYVATGFEIEPLDEAELHRITFVGALPWIQSQPDDFQSPSIICEVSGGTTEVLFFQADEVMFSQSYRQGSLRIRKTLEALSGPVITSRRLLASQLAGMIGQIKQEADKYDLQNMIAIGGDIRFAANQLGGGDISESMARIEIDDLCQFTEEILAQSKERLAARYHISLPDAESLGPALLAYCQIARDLQIKKLFVADFNLRDGLVEQMVGGGKWAKTIERQTIRSAIQVGRKFSFDEAHAVHVSRLASLIYDQLRDLHQLKKRYHVILELAAILHEIGLFVSTRSYHKHSLYLIRNAEFFGISGKDVELVALVARYHRRATPQPSHDGYSKLSRKDRVSVTKLASMLRIAKALDASRTQRIQNISCERVGDCVQIVIHDEVDVSVERLELRRSASLFTDIFGVGVDIEVAGSNG